MYNDIFSYINNNIEGQDVATSFSETLLSRELLLYYSSKENIMEHKKTGGIVYKPLKIFSDLKQSW